MVVFPNAKINIGLRVTGKRDDGFHNIESVFYPIRLCDALEAVPHDLDDCSLELLGKNIDGDPKKNLVYRAWALMRHHYGIGGVHAVLVKKIPMGAGLGGGSADGAYMLMLLNELFDLSLSRNQLEHLAAELGSDCPFFIRNSPQYVTGRGETMEDCALDLHGKHLILIKPEVHIGTADAYSMISPKPASNDLRDMVSLPISSWTGMIENTFESPIAAKFPAIAESKEKLQKMGAIYTSMTGSGSAVYGIFNEEPSIKLEDGPYEQFSLEL